VASILVGIGLVSRRTTSENRRSAEDASVDVFCGKLEQNILGGALQQWQGVFRVLNETLIYHVDGQAHTESPTSERVQVRIVSVFDVGELCLKSETIWGALEHWANNCSSKYRGEYIGL
jgi:hypothetical protein